MIKPTFKLDRRVKKKIQAAFAGGSAEAGVLKDGPHRRAQSKKKGFDNLSGNRIRKKSRKVDGTIGQVSERIRKNQVDYLRRPFDKDGTKTIREMKKSFFAYMQGKGTKKEAEAALQLVIRDPIFRRKYGPNSPKARKNKGFSWRLVDTAQFFKAIIARVKKKGR